MTMDVPDPEAQRLGAEEQALAGLQQELMGLAMNPQDPEMTDSQVASRADNLITQAPETDDPTFALAVETLAAGAMKGSRGADYDARVLARLQAIGIDPVEGGKLGDLMIVTRTAVHDPGAAEIRDAQCAHVAQAGMQVLLTNENLTDAQRRTIATTILYAGQAASPQSQVGSRVQQNLPKTLEQLR